VNYTFLCDFFIFFIFLGPTYRRDPWTDFDAQWLKRRGIAQGCAFFGVQNEKLKSDPYLPKKKTKKFGPE